MANWAIYLVIFCLLAASQAAPILKDPLDSDSTTGPGNVSSGQDYPFNNTVFDVYREKSGGCTLKYNKLKVYLKSIFFFSILHRVEKDRNPCQVYVTICVSTGEEGGRKSQMLRLSQWGNLSMGTPVQVTSEEELQPPRSTGPAPTLQRHHPCIWRARRCLDGLYRVNRVVLDCMRGIFKKFPHFYIQYVTLF